MIRWESVIIAVFGAVLGIAIGVFFGWALQQALAPEGVTELAIPVGQLAGLSLFAALAGVLAAIWPARRAAKLNMLEAISYEYRQSPGGADAGRYHGASMPEADPARRFPRRAPRGGAGRGRAADGGGRGAGRRRARGTSRSCPTPTRPWSRSSRPPTTASTCSATRRRT